MDRDRRGRLARVSEQEWDERYAASERIWSGRPNEALVDEVADLAPGRALDVGCGEGADAVWLAQRGWQVTGLDVSGVALERGRAWAAENDVDVTWVKSGLLGADLTPGAFDLVVVMYPPLPRTADSSVERALAGLVAPGGRLLVVHHAVDGSGGHGHGHGHGDGHGQGGGDGEHHGPDFSTMIAPESVRPVLSDDWVVEVDERRERSLAEGAGARHIKDVVLRAQRLG
ncbi:MAG TPA: class I SAM-dependent methyltransferase [Propionibacterium sp.]|nr:class I SAM-dependent methyltransferase [Propionibacterium sp.]